jgi:tRNA pseudouridine32 synthase/23S rRNA pseudouridine746 synthase
MSVSDCFTIFKSDISGIALPEKFNFPFNYEPHILAKIAAQELMGFITTQGIAMHDFGHEDGENGLGKMFGVLVVQNKDGNTGYISAFSGKLAGGNHVKGFVPPVFDTLAEDGFYRLGEEEINKVNSRIDQLEQGEVFRAQKAHLQSFIDQTGKELAMLKYELANAKKSRAQQRKLLENMAENEAETERLNHESIRQHYLLKDRKKQIRKEIECLQNQLNPVEIEIKTLKEQRKQMSARLQQQLFENYTFLNQCGKNKNLKDIFRITDDVPPPSGAGECAAPKLLQYAFAHEMKPITMAEFWWGRSPASEIRRHGYFYPACNSKCKPILQHMLDGMDVESDPIRKETMQQKQMSIIYEDQYLLAINKPVEFLSVPGKTICDSVYSRIKDMYPDASGPLIVHRLDMATSGVMVVAKTEEIYHHLQQQFINRKIKKRYIAILDGLVKDDRGTIDLPLRVDLDDRPRQLVCFQYGKQAVTHWQVIDRKDGATRIYFFPGTGRTHQLRTHAAHPSGLNTPIKGDDLYGKKSDRLYLHAETLTFEHPVYKRMVNLHVPPDF